MSEGMNKFTKGSLAAELEGLGERSLEISKRYDIKRKLNVVQFGERLEERRNRQKGKKRQGWHILS